MLFQSQQAREALVKLMMLARYADSKLSIVEKNTFERIVDQLQWEGVKSEYTFKDKCIAEVRAAYQSEAATQNFITEQCRLITDKEEKHLALKKVQSVLMADDMVFEENVLYNKIKQELGFF